ncbi:MAG: hypothetical protein K2Q14_01475 [Gammaproteobacteria bacterium]|nr:hypothetical protein [Nitrosomonas sp.]MBY0544201.1 hypothetical protein [Gammaproteobacteria bacterium]
MDALRRIKDRRETLRRIRELNDQKNTVLIIHYSCESFYDRPDGSTPRITSIAIRNLASGQTESFSIHKIAELRKIPLMQISSHYDQLEKEMLDEFSEFLRLNIHCIWIHWNMRDINYGFQAIEHRHKILGGNYPQRLPEERKFDLARALISIYGIGYAGHPRLESIMKINKITDKNFLIGKQEAVAFENGEFVKLHQSTLRKVDILANLFGRTVDGSLKTNASWWEARGIHPQAVSALLTEHWMWTLLMGLGTIASITALILM